MLRSTGEGTSLLAGIDERAELVRFRLSQRVDNIVGDFKRFSLREVLRLGYIF